jgi:hypothetical protein
MSVQKTQSGTKVVCTVGITHSIRQHFRSWVPVLVIHSVHCDSVLVVAEADVLADVTRIRTIVHNTLSVVCVAVLRRAAGRGGSAWITEVEEDQPSAAAVIAWLRANGNSVVGRGTKNDVMGSTDGQLLATSLVQG